MKCNGNIFVFSVADIDVDAITLELTIGEDSYFLIDVYASHVYSTRFDFWNHLSELRDRNFNPARARTLSNVLDNCYMTDMHTIGCSFTWQHNCVDQRRVVRKLDRAMTDIMWRHHFSEALMEILCRFHSDRNPILLRCDGFPEARGDRPFRFEVALMTHPEYHVDSHCGRHKNLLCKNVCTYPQSTSSI